MGRPKATLAWETDTFVASELRAMRRAALSPLVLVCGVHEAETRDALPEDVEVALVRNPDPRRGQLSSLKVALRALGRSHVEGALVALVDHPAVRADTLALLRDAVRIDRIAVPMHHGRRGHPVVFGRALFAELLSTPDAAGARRVVRRAPGRVDALELEDSGVLLDIDTPEDLERLGGRISPGGARR